MARKIIILAILIYVFVLCLGGVVRANNQPTTRQVEMLVTAYCPCKICCGPNAKGITASGRKVSYNGGKFCAADPGLPFGTMIYVPGYHNQPVPVIDRGGAIKGDHIDVFFKTHTAARQWGKRHIAVTIYE